MMKTSDDDFKSLIGTEATVVSVESQGYGQCLGEAGHELWTHEALKHCVLVKE